MFEVQSRTPLMSIDAVALDTETTGLDPKESRVIQLGAVRLIWVNALRDAPEISSRPARP